MHRGRRQEFGTSSSVGKMSHPPLSPPDVSCGLTSLSGGTSGCVVAGRLAEDPNISVLVIEAGPHSENIETVHMVGG